jgi:hypothetical protein
MSCDFLLEDEGYGANLFHTYSKVGEKACATTIDLDSSINAVGIDMVEKLELSMTPHPRPYTLRRCHDKLNITHQTVVSFSIGKYSCDVLCDVISVPLVSCHLLLGEQWCTKNGATYDGCANTYTITLDKVYVLRPLEKMLFRAWRKGRLQKKKKTATSIPSLGAHIAGKTELKPIIDQDIANETDLKPRTVSSKEGEDDTAPPILDVACTHAAAMEEIISDQNDKKEMVLNVQYGFHGQRCMQKDLCIQVDACIHIVRMSPWTITFAKDHGNMHARKEIKIYFLFLFLPIKERIWQGISVRDKLSLKSIGWGPPTGSTKMAHLNKESRYFSYVPFKRELASCESSYLF